MTDIKVLIVPAGSGMAVAAIKSLKVEKGIKVISADVNKLAPGLYLSDKGYLIPPFNSSEFFPKIMKIVKKENIDVIIPALDTILLPFSKMREKFESNDVKVLASDPKTIEITRDKWKTYNELKDVIPLPKSFIRIEDIDLEFPLFIKPRSGSGSKDVYKVNSREELEFFYRQIKDPIIQEYLSGREYTVDCLADLERNLLVAIPRIRIETKAGISVKGQIIKDERLEDMAKRISKKLKFQGPFFFQAKEDKRGTPKLTEINARISGTMSLSSASGVNIHVLAVKLCVGEKIEIPKIKYGTYITRYFEDIYLNDADISNKVYQV